MPKVIDYNYRSIDLKLFDVMYIQDLSIIFLLIDYLVINIVDAKSTRKALRPKRVENDASARPPNLCNLLLCVTLN